MTALRKAGRVSSSGVRARHTTGVARPTLAVYLVAGMASAAIAFVMFAPTLVTQFAPARAVLLVLIWLAILFTPRYGRYGGVLWGVPALGAGVYALLLLLGLFGLDLTPQGWANAQRYTLLLPAAIALGIALRRSEIQRVFAVAYLSVATLFVAPALIEVATAQSLFGREFTYFIEYGRPRALLAADHPLVLGLLFLVAIPMCMYIRSALRPICAMVLGVGVWTTASEGPIAVAVVALVPVLFPKLGIAFLRRPKLIGFVLITAAVVGLIFSTSIWSTDVYGQTSGEYSRGYRAASYAVLPRMLLEAPLGYGLEGLPGGRWLFETEYKGVRDLAITIDSEIVFLAALFGVAGIAAFVWAVALAVRTTLREWPFSIAALALLVMGVVLALTVWDTVCALTGIVLGVCIAASRLPAPVLENKLG